MKLAEGVKSFFSRTSTAGARSGKRVNENMFLIRALIGKLVYSSRYLQAGNFILYTVENFTAAL
uniref:Uncharacterized protein n=1 Tax=Romanomermis culicivorax TaxID=13658 RepID=A0A915KF96_ROMCU